MSDMTQAQIDAEFQRQVRLCAGIGHARMMEIVNAAFGEENEGGWLRTRCYSCGHILRFPSDGCPQCGMMFDGRPDPNTWPKRCGCERCR